MKTIYCLSILLLFASVSLLGRESLSGLRIDARGCPNPAGLQIVTKVYPNSPDLGSEWNSEERNGMVLRWRIQEKHLLVEMTAPTTGWVAIGFNTRSGLKGTHLLMGKVVNGEAVVSDRYVVAPGNHQAIEALGGNPCPDMISGHEEKQHTELSFRVPLYKADEWRHALIPGRQYHVLMAFSREDDFQHHSMMRTEITIHL